MSQSGMVFEIADTCVRHIWLTFCLFPGNITLENKTEISVGIISTVIELLLIRYCNVNFT